MDLNKKVANELIDWMISFITLLDRCEKHMVDNHTCQLKVDTTAFKYHLNKLVTAKGYLKNLAPELVKRIELARLIKESEELRGRIMELKNELKTS